MSGDMNNGYAIPDTITDSKSRSQIDKVEIRQIHGSFRHHNISIL